MGCWRGYLSGARCRLAYGPADATATHCLLLKQSPDWFYLSGIPAHLGSPGKRAVKRACVYVCIAYVGLCVWPAVKKQQWAERRLRRRRRRRRRRGVRWMMNVVVGTSVVCSRGRVHPADCSAARLRRMAVRRVPLQSILLSTRYGHSSARTR